MNTDKFLKLSILSWLTIGIVIINLNFNTDYKDLLDFNQKTYFILLCFGLYIILSIMFFAIKISQNKKDILTETLLKSQKEITYFESKVQFYVTSIVAIISCISLSYFMGDSFLDLFLWISIIFFVAVIFSARAEITLNDKGFKYKRGFRVVFAEWSEVEGLHADPPISSVGRISYQPDNPSTFVIQTVKGDCVIRGGIIKIKGHYSLFKTSGDRLLRQLSEYSNVQLTNYSYSISNIFASRNISKKKLIFLFFSVVIFISLCFFVADYLIK